MERRHSPLGSPSPAPRGFGIPVWLSVGAFLPLTLGLVQWIEPELDPDEVERRNSAPVAWFHPDARGPHWPYDRVVRLPDGTTARWGDLIGGADPAMTPKAISTRPSVRR